MDNLNEEIDLVLAESLLEQSLRSTEDLRQADWEEFQDLLSRGEVADDWEAFKRNKDRKSGLKRMKKQRRKSAKRGRAARRRLGMRRGGRRPEPREEPPSDAPTPETEPEEPETATSSEEEIIVPDIAPGGGARFVGGLRYVGTPFDTNMRKFVDKTPIGKYSIEIVALMRAFASLALANKILDSFESARLAGAMRSRVGLRRRALAEELNADQLSFIKNSGKDFKKILDEINQLFDTEEARAAETRMKIKISKVIIKLKDKKKELESEQETKDAYLKNNYLIEPLMKEYAKVLANYQWSDEAEEAGDGTEEAGGGPEEPTVVTEGKLATIKVDFNELRAQSLNEGFLETFGGIIELVLGAMFGNKKLPIAFSGSEGDIHAFADTIGREKRYMDAVKRYGLDHPTTYKSKAKLGNSVKSFERETGIKWPFK